MKGRRNLTSAKLRVTSLTCLKWSSTSGETKRKDTFPRSLCPSTWAFSSFCGSSRTTPKLKWKCYGFTSHSRTCSHSAWRSSPILWSEVEAEIHFLLLCRSLTQSWKTCVGLKALTRKTPILRFRRSRETWLLGLSKALSRYLTWATISKTLDLMK